MNSKHLKINNWAEGGGGGHPGMNSKHLKINNETSRQQESGKHIWNSS